MWKNPHLLPHLQWGQTLPCVPQTCSIRTHNVFIFVFYWKCLHSFSFLTFNLILKEKLSQQLSMLLIQCLTKSSVLLHSSARRVELFQHKNNCKVSFYLWSHKNVHKSSGFFNFSFTNLNKGMSSSSMSCTDHWVLYFAVGSGNDWFHRVIWQKA